MRIRFGMPVADSVKNLTFDEVLADRGYRFRNDFGKKVSLAPSVLSLLAQGWPGAFEVRSTLKRELDLTDDELNAVLLRSWKAHVRSLPKS